MCRLAYVPKRWKGIPAWFKQMEKSFGGDGNGVAIGDKVLKGVKVSVKDTILAMANDNRPALWHTRRASVGAKVNELCHPFPCLNGWLVHNGHWSDGAYLSQVFRDLGDRKPLSDSLIFSRLVNELGFVKATERYEPKGVWMWMNSKGELFVYKNTGSLYYCHQFGSWGSEPARNRGMWTEVRNGLWLPGDEPGSGIVGLEPVDRSIKPVKQSPAPPPPNVNGSWYEFAGVDIEKIYTPKPEVATVPTAGKACQWDDRKKKFV